MRPVARLTLMCVALAVLGAGALPTAGFAVDFPEGVPYDGLPAPDDIAKFSATLSGGQRDSERFVRIPEPDGCSLHMEGTLVEGWAYNRNNKVNLEFTRFGNKIYLQRTGRQLGDTAFATKGELRRSATGFMKIMGPSGCITYPLPDPTICGKTVKAPLDLRLDYSKGRITLKGSGPSAAVPNPAEKCGQAPNGGSSFNQLSHPYPHLNKLKGSLSKRKIFGHTRKFEIQLKDTFIEPADAFGFSSFSEQFSGDATIDLVRK